MNHPNLTNKQLDELDSLFELVSQRQIKDFGNISASNKADGSLTSCDLWSDKTIVDGLASIAPDEGVLSEEGGKSIPNTKAYWWWIHLMTTNLLQEFHTGQYQLQGSLMVDLIFLFNNPNIEKSLYPLEVKVFG